jgi:hypothetical protein
MTNKPFKSRPTGSQEWPQWHVFIGYVVRKTMEYENMIIVLQIVINNGFYCRKSYRLLKKGIKTHLSGWHHNMNTHCPRNLPSIVKIHVIPQLLFKQRTIHGGQCSCFNVITIFHLPLSRRQICTTRFITIVVTLKTTFHPHFWIVGFLSSRHFKWWTDVYNGYPDLWVLEERTLFQVTVKLSVFMDPTTCITF